MLLNFKNNENMAHSTSPEYDMLWKLRSVFYNFTNVHSTIYHPSENLAIDEVTVKYKGRIRFQQDIPKKQKRSGIKLYKLCDSKEYTYDMIICLGKLLKMSLIHTEQCSS
jgi:hypothetical protein